MNEKKKLAETRLEGEVLFEGRLLRLERDRVRLPNGTEALREIVRHPGAVAVIALYEQELLMVRQFRYPVGRETLEIPAGKIDPQEAPLACAIRELREETGYRGTMEEIATFYTTPGFSDEVMHVFLASDLSWDPLTMDDDEFIALERIPWAEALKLARNNGFIDAKTILGILLAEGHI
ncbi:ADP-ribose pyrophosphatase [Desulfosporosinus acidiphilus SJ4]|uniref:ADP-ribose pyrophosphatase n=1 Tax=Desulfosporosinus acidiphilus (strain DSM 22704 / JCM 16185 / SJ4) TaxID=646529 RepID=I4D8T9_DESAJ|nr:NUDIX hydrolase [Desulfosporosinus acidiphilus]AFM42213.1 ADP-ribose pyrophosphatase [Desulfosporosinus acidiphilus SJ4]